MANNIRKERAPAQLNFHVGFQIHVFKFLGFFFFFFYYF